MIYVREALISSHDQRDADLQVVQLFLHNHGSGLTHAAYQLGGGSSSGAVSRLIDDVRESQKLTASHIRRLERLHALLSLDDVGDPDRIETEFFAYMVPGSEMVDEICILTDALDDLLRRLSAKRGDVNANGASSVLNAA